MDTKKTYSMDLTIQSVNPELLALLTGQDQGGVGVNQAGLEIHTRIKRTFWQWLRRKPIQHRIIFIPAARIKFEPSE